MNEPLKQKDSDKVVLGTVGEFKTYGQHLPSFTDETPDDANVAISLENAIKIATSIIDTWELTPAQQTIVLKENDRQRITDILHIDMYLDILLSGENKLDWILGKNQAFSNMKVTDYILKHGTEKVVEYLALHADGGGW